MNSPISICERLTKSGAVCAATVFLLIASFLVACDGGSEERDRPPSSPDESANLDPRANDLKNFFNAYNDAKNAFVECVDNVPWRDENKTAIGLKRDLQQCIDRFSGLSTSAPPGLDSRITMLIIRCKRNWIAVGEARKSWIDQWTSDTSDYDMALSTATDSETELRAVMNEIAPQYNLRFNQ